MSGRTEHDLSLERLDTCVRGLGGGQLVAVYERVLDALWLRAHRSLGEITMLAIVDRVLHNSTQLFPHLSALKLESSGIGFGELRSAAASIDVGTLEQSLRVVVRDLLTVLGNLTAEVLTPGLHEEVSRVVEAVNKAGKV
jgi:hypothetical protein